MDVHQDGRPLSSGKMADLLTPRSCIGYLCILASCDANRAQQLASKLHVQHSVVPGCRRCADALQSNFLKRFAVGFNSLLPAQQPQ